MFVVLTIEMKIIGYKLDTTGYKLRYKLISMVVSSEHDIRVNTMKRMVWFLRDPTHLVSVPGAEVGKARGATSTIRLVIESDQVMWGRRVMMGEEESGWKTLNTWTTQIN